MMGVPLKKYLLFGISLASDFPFSYPLLLTKGEPDLTITYNLGLPIDLSHSEFSPSYTSHYKYPDGESFFQFYRLDECDVLHFSKAADFYTWPDRALCQPLQPIDDLMIETVLLGTVLSYCLESRDVPVLHASTVQFGSGEIAFLARSGGGKSSLAASLIQSGSALVSDDILAIRQQDGQFFGYPGFPAMRLWPDQAYYFLGTIDGLHRMNNHTEKLLIPLAGTSLDNFIKAPLPLSCLYLPKRRDPGEEDTTVKITYLSPPQVLQELLRHSFIPRLVHVLGLAPRRLLFLADLARTVPMRHLVYPSGLKYLPMVREAILEDLARL